MSTKRVMLVILVASLVVLAQSGGGSDSPQRYIVEQGTASGGRYCLTSLT